MSASRSSSNCNQKRISCTSRGIEFDLNRAGLQDRVVLSIHRLPIELLATIFAFCLPDEPRFPHLKEAPLLLLRICSHWRSVALATPWLWCYIRGGLYISASSWELKPAWVELWLLRSSQYPLKIVLFSASPPNSHRALDAVVQHAYRWEDVSLHLRAPWLVYLKPIKGKLSQLRKLRLELTGDPGAQFQPICTFQTAPKLQEVIISVQHAEIDLPWKQLLRATLSCSIPDCVEFIYRASNLVECTLGRCWVDRDTPRERLIVSQLIALHIKEEHPSGVASIFEYLTLSALQDLSITLVEGTDWPQSHFMDFISRSGCRIERLALIGVSITYQELVSLLQELSSLVELHIFCAVTTDAEGRLPIVDDDLLTRLTCNTSSDIQSILLPNLRAITLWGTLPFGGHNLFNMVQSRFLEPPPYVARFAYVRLQYNREWDELVIRRLERLREDGLELLIENLPISRYRGCSLWDGFRLD